MYEDVVEMWFIYTQCQCIGMGGFTKQFGAAWLDDYIWFEQSCVLMN